MIPRRIRKSVIQLVASPQALRDQDTSELEVRYAAVMDYLSTWQAMKDFTASRTDNTSDEIWLLQHPPVYTQGVACKPEHLLYNKAFP